MHTVSLKKYEQYLEVPNEAFIVLFLNLKSFKAKTANAASFSFK